MPWATAVVAIVAALFAFVQFVLVYWFITTHLQQIIDAGNQAAKIFGTAIGSAVTPLVLGLLGAAAGLAVIAVVYSKSTKSPAPKFGEITSAYPATVGPVAGATIGAVGGIGAASIQGGSHLLSESLFRPQAYAVGPSRQTRIGGGRRR